MSTVTKVIDAHAKFTEAFIKLTDENQTLTEHLLRQEGQIAELLEQKGAMDEAFKRLQVDNGHLATTARLKSDENVRLTRLKEVLSSKTASPSPTASASGGGAAATDGKWACAACTFENEQTTLNCGMCYTVRPMTSV